MKLGLGGRSVLTVVAVLGWAATSHAQATRTWVSGVGDDANPCSRTAPCKTFAGAISKTAANGEINVLDPGGFGAVTITKSITIDGSGGSIAGVLVSGTNGIVVNSATAVVTLRNLDIDGIGTGLRGISFLAGARLNVENCLIYGFTQQGISMTPSGNAQLNVRNTTIRNNGGSGISISPTGGAIVTAAISDVQLLSNDRGLQVNDGGRAMVVRTVAANSINNGFSASGSSLGADLMLADSVASGNTVVGVRAVGTSAIRLSNNTIVHNGIGMDATSGGTLASFVNNHVTGNTVTDGTAGVTLTPR